MLKSEPLKLLVAGNVIFLYGYIGEMTDAADAAANENRDIDFVVQLESLCQLYPSVDVRINSNGGSVRHGSAMISAIQRHQDKVTTYNDGMAASIAADIWMAATNRKMAKNAMLMIHAPSGGCYGTAQQMREYADSLEELAQGTIDLMAQATAQPADTIKAAVAHAMGTHIDLFQRIVISPCSITAIAYSLGGPVVLTVNSTGGSLAELRPS